MNKDEAEILTLEFAKDMAFRIAPGTMSIQDAEAMGTRIAHECHTGKIVLNRSWDLVFQDLFDSLKEMVEMLEQGRHPSKEQHEKAVAALTQAHQSYLDE